MRILHEVRMILPLRNPGKVTDEVMDEIHSHLANECVKLAGGLTVTNANGLYRSKEGVDMTEEIVIYDVACLPRVEEKLRMALCVAGTFAEQESVYFRHGNGVVEIIVLGE